MMDSSGECSNQPDHTAVVAVAPIKQIIPPLFEERENGTMPVDVIIDPDQERACESKLNPVVIGGMNKEQGFTSKVINGLHSWMACVWPAPDVDAPASSEILYESIREISFIGSGSHGAVYLGDYQRRTVNDALSLQCRPVI